MNRHPHCTCTLGTNPACPVDHEVIEERIDRARDAKLADLAWVCTTLVELPELTYYTPDAGNAAFRFPGDYSGRDTLLALLHGDDAELLAVAKRLRDAVRKEAYQEAAQAEQDRQVDAEYERQVSRGQNRLDDAA